MDIQALLKMDSPTWKLINDLESDSKSQHKDLVKVNRIQQQIKIFREKLQKTQARLSHVSAKIKVRQETLKQHQNQKRRNVHRDRFSKKSPQYHVWKNPQNFENVLEKKVTKFSFGQSKNKHTRAEIDALRREKMMRQRINQNLEQEILDVKHTISDLGQVVENLEHKHKQRRQQLIVQRKKIDDKSEIAKLGIKHVADRLQQENQRTKVDFFQGISNWDRVNPSGLGGSTLCGSGKKPTKVNKRDFDEQDNMAEAEKLTTKVEALEQVLRVWFTSTETSDVEDLKRHIESTCEENTVRDGLTRRYCTSKRGPCWRN